MQPSVSTNDDFTRYYTAAIDALCKIASSYFYLGRLGDTQHLLGASLNLIEADEVAQADRLKLLLLYGKVLTVDHLMSRGDADLMFSTMLQTKHIADALEEQQSIADALSLLGQAHTNATTVSIIKSGALPFGPRVEGHYEE